MKISMYLAIAGAVAILFGAALLLLPEITIKQYGVPTEPHNLMQARYFGGTLLGYGLVLWLGRNLRDDAALRVILQAGVVGNAVGAIVSAHAAVAGLQNEMAWGSVALFVLFLMGNLFYLSSVVRRA